MGKYTLFIVFASAWLVGCGQQKPTDDEETLIAQILPDPADKTVYGLACDGCNDTVLVFLRLPFDGSAPDTLQVLNASKLHRVIGMPHVGDNLAILRSEEDTTQADLVIVTEQLHGQWCYEAYPVLRRRAGMEGHPLSSDSVKADSLRMLLKTPHEYGFVFKSDNMMRTLGAQFRAASSNNPSPVEYPTVEYYNEWKIFNGRLVLLRTKIDSLGVVNTLASDTADIVFLHPDSLVLRMHGEERGYYAKHTDE